MPGGSDYQGPADSLEMYTSVVNSSGADVEVKGAKNPYTSRNGHMFSFLDAAGTMALRLSDELRENFQAKHESGPVIQYGSVMRGYASVPANLLAKTDELSEWFDRAHDWIGTLEPKPTKKRKQGLAVVLVGYLAL